ncbi:hypothetical protein NQU49_26035, partial [Escherichia coli]|uniref:hypothetical protein n=1 Tax=Escherichia coli TaxID=562 RepID=UPI0021174A18
KSKNRHLCGDSFVLHNVASIQGNKVRQEASGEAAGNTRFRETGIEIIQSSAKGTRRLRKYSQIAIPVAD